MVFRISKKHTNCEMQINIDNQHIERVKEKVFLKYFGVFLNENLNWKSEISHVANKVSKSIGIICSLYLPKLSLRIPYYSLTYSYFYYFDTVWASTCKTNLRRLVILKKAIIRVINNSSFVAHTDPIFKEPGILKFTDIHDTCTQLGQFMYSYINSFLQPF